MSFVIILGTSLRNKNFATMHGIVEFRIDIRRSNLEKSRCANNRQVKKYVLVKIKSYKSKKQ